MADNIIPGSTNSPGSELLPRIFRTDSNKKFIQATIDQLIQPGTVKKVNGFIGRQNSKSSTGADVFVTAANKSRQDYQLEPSLTVKDALGNTTYFKDYIDYINQLTVFGANTVNHSRINKQEFYSWNPHIDWDKFANFNQYYWLPYGPNVIKVYGQSTQIVSTYTVALQNEIGNYQYVLTPDGLTPNPTLTLYRGQTYKFDITSPGNPFTIKTRVSLDTGDIYSPSSGLTNNQIESGTLTFTVPVNSPDILYYVSEANPDVNGTINIVDIQDNSYLDVSTEILGKKSYTMTNGVSLSNGMKLEFGGTVTPAKYATGKWYVEGVGTAIQLVAETDLDIITSYTVTEDLPFDEEPFDTKPFAEASGFAAVRDYIVIDRASQDRNPWSRFNRWFHKDVIIQSATLSNTIPELNQDSRAIRPIIEFEADLKLFNFGNISIADVDLVDTYTADVMSTIEGSTGYIVDGVSLVQGHRVLFLADKDIYVNSQIFTVDFVTIAGNRQIHLIPSVTPVEGNTVLVKSGKSHQSSMYWYNGTVWKLGQQKNKNNQPPAFDLVDKEKVSFADLTKYPGSTFFGTEIFSYKVGSGAVDSNLGFAIAHKNIDNIGDIVFRFGLANDTFTYLNGEVISTLQTNIGFLIKTTFAGTTQYVNGWKTSEIANVQPALRIYKNSQLTNNFNIDIFDDINNLSDLTVKVYVNGVRVDPKNYTVVNGTIYKKIKFKTAVSLTDVVTIKAYTNQPINSNGHYEIPVNLQNNPVNNEILEFTLGEVIDHVSSIVENLNEFSGIYPGDGNLRDLPNSTAYGTKFVQHSGPLGLGLYHITIEANNVIRALEKAREDYVTFKRNFIIAATKLGIDDTPAIQVDLILQKLVQDKVPTGPYYTSDMVPFGANISRDVKVVDKRITSYPLSATFSLTALSTKAVLVYLNGTQLIYGKDYTFDPLGFVIVTATKAVGDTLTIKEYENTSGSYIPQTPSKLGIYPKYEPKIYTDTALVTPRLMIQGHDGSQILAYGDYRDNIILELEKRIYNNIKVTYDPAIFDLYDLIPSYNRPNDYSLAEFNQVLAPNFYKWSSLIDRDFTKPLSYDRNNPLTYNYKGHSAPDGRPVPGYWRGIYRWLYDTDKPNLAPWEMLGFTSQPTWWEGLYGPAPYTKDNLIMWQDIAAGLVKDPAVAPYVITKFKRSYLLAHIPVDDQGNILDPYSIGVAQGLITQATDADFVFGDISPVEAAWRRSSHYSFSLIITALLLRPAQTFGVFLDKSRISRNLAGQIVYTDTNLRIRPYDVVLPSLYSSNSSTLTSGLINYIVDYILSDTLKSYNSYQYDLNNINAQLSYRLGAFTSKEKFNFLLDSRTPVSKGSVFVPPENYSVVLNSSSAIKKLTYSGIIITKLTDGFEVKGYSKTQPYFKSYSYVGSGITVNVGGISESFQLWEGQQTYAAGKIIQYNGKYYRSLARHTTTTVFQPQFYVLLGSLPIVGGTSAVLRTSWDKNNLVTVPYGTKFYNIQSVVDFILGYGEWLKDEGFIFDSFNSTLQAVTNWETSAKEFLFWTTQNWSVGQNKWKDWLPNQDIPYNTIVRYNGDYYQAIQTILASTIFDDTKYTKLDGLSTVGSAVLSLSPAADTITFNTTLAVVEDITSNFNPYEIFKVDGTPLEPRFINLYRKDNAVSYTTKTNDGIFGASFYLVQKEQVVLLDNSTLFNDTIYNPETGYRQERIKVSGYTSINWYGGFDVPGFIFDEALITEWEPWKDYNIGELVKYGQFYLQADPTGNIVPGAETLDTTQWLKLSSKPSPKLIPNWTYKVAQFQDFYSLDSDNFDSDQQKVAQHLIGYQQRDYLNNIIQDPVSEFKFYQGMIREKGTKNVLSKLFDVLSSENKESITFYEEWALRVGEYGTSKAYENVEFILDESKFKSNPQGVELLDSLNPPYYDLTIRQLPTDIYLKPIGYNSSPWPLVNNYRSYLRSAGYVRPDEVKLTLYSLDSILTQDITGISEGDYIWVGFEGVSWNVYRFTDANYVVKDVTYAGTTLTITFDIDHVLTAGSYIGIKEVTGFAGFYKIDLVSLNTITITTKLTTPPASPFTEQSRILIFLLQTQRARNTYNAQGNVNDYSIDIADSIFPRVLKPRELLWTDDNGSGKWTVWENNPVYNSVEIGYAYPASQLNLGRTVALSEDGFLLLAGTNNGELLVYDKASSASSWIQRETVTAPAISKNDSFGGNLNTPDQLAEVIALSPDKTWLAVGHPRAGYAATHLVSNSGSYSWNVVNTYSTYDIVALGTNFYQAISSVPANNPPQISATAKSQVVYSTVTDATVAAITSYYIFKTTLATSVSAGVQSLTVTSVSGIYVGINITGTNIPANTIVTNINALTKVITLNNTVGVILQSTILTFGDLLNTRGITVSSTTGIVAGMSVVGTGIASNTTVSLVDSINNIVILTLTSTSTPSGRMIFGANSAKFVSTAEYQSASAVVAGWKIIAGSNLVNGTVVTGRNDANLLVFFNNLTIGSIAGSIAFANAASLVTASAGSNTLTVTTPANIYAGQTLSTPIGIPDGTTVLSVVGNTVTISANTTASLTSVFVIFGQNHLVISSLTGQLSVNQLTTGSGLASLTAVAAYLGSNVFLSKNTLSTVNGTVVFSGGSTYWKAINYIPIDATGTNSTLVSQGAISIYKKDLNNIFQLVDTIVSPSPSANEKFGTSLIFGTQILDDGTTSYNLFVGAEGYSNNTGKVYVLTYENFVQASASYNPSASSNTAVKQIVVDKPGSGYTTAPTVNIGTPNTSGSIPAKATATIGVVAVTTPIVYSGAGYILGDILTISGGTYTAPAKLRVTQISGTGAIQSVLIYDTGVYSSAASAANNIVTGGTGSGARFTVTFGVTAITVTVPGSGYDLLTSPFVSFTSTSGTGAEAYALIGSVIGLSDTTGIVNGMVLKGTGFNSNQYVTQVVSATSVTTGITNATAVTGIVGGTGNNYITVGSVTGLVIGMLVEGTGIASGATISSFLSGTTIIYVTKPNTGTVSGYGTFGRNSVKVDSLTGIAPGMTVTANGVAAGTQVISANLIQVPATLSFLNIVIINQLTTGTVYGLGTFNYPNIKSGFVVINAAPDSTPNGLVFFTIPSWAYTSSLTAPNGQAQFGHSLGVDRSSTQVSNGQFLVIGAPGIQTASATVTGAFNYYQYVSNAWTLLSTTNGAYGFGTSVDMTTDGSYIAVGSPLVGSGAVSVYEYNTTSQLYDFLQNLTNISPEPVEKFGTSVKFVNNSTTLVVYSANADSFTTTTWSDDTVFDSGATNFRHYEYDSGRIDIYDNYNTKFIFSERLSNIVGANASYGKGFSVGTDNILVGAPRATTSGLVSGRIFEYLKTPNIYSWEPVHTELDKVDISKIKRAFIYDRKTSQVLSYLDVIDPLQGKIPGPADQEISYKAFYDPAVYNVGDSTVNVRAGMTWGDDQVGQLWWDLRTAKFIDGHDDNIIYRTSLWATIFPGASIDIYEWVKSKYSPVQWNNLADTEAGLAQGISGTSLYTTTETYSLVTKYDNVSNTSKNTYYFWVKNKTIAPTTGKRTLSASSVASLISNPRGEGYKYLALTGPNSFSLANIKPLLKHTDAVLSVEYWTVDNADTKNIHRQYALISNDTSSHIPARIEEKWFDSLCGKDLTGKDVPDLSLPPKLRYGIEFRPRQSMFINRYEALKQVIEQVNRTLLANQIVENRNLSALDSYEAEPSVQLGLYDGVKDYDTELSYINITSFVSPVLVPVLTDGRITSVIVVNSGSGYAHAPYISVVGTGQGAVLKSKINAKGSITSVTVVSPGEGYASVASTILSVRSYSVLVHSDSQAGNAWSIYSFDIASQVWSRTQTQNYDVRKYWTKVDWYATGYSQNTSPTHVVNIFTDLATISVNIGEVVKVKTNNKGEWTLLKKFANSSSVDYTQSYHVIGIQNGTIQFNSSLYKFTSTIYGYDGGLYDGTNFDLVASKELRIILNTIKNNLLVEELKTVYLDLFFYSIRYAYSEQAELDWVFKTGFVKAMHNIGSLDQPVTYQPNNLADFERYIDEVKPYRTKIREYISNFNKTESNEVMTTDFDLPSTYTNNLFQTINTSIADGVISVDNPIVNTYPWKNWLDNVGYSVIDLKIVNGGSGYINEPEITISGTSGSGATARAFIANGQINRIVLLTNGKGYISAPTVTINGGVSSTGTPARIIAIIGDSKIRTTKINVKFDRTTQNYFITNLEQTETFIGTGSRIQYPLTWAPNVRLGTSSVTVNGVPVLRDNYKLATVTSTTKGYHSYSGSITLEIAPAKDSIISVTYLKDSSILNATDRIQHFYNPESGQPGKDLSQLMTGIDYGGVIVNGIGFDVNTGWGSTPYWSDKWDSQDSTFNDFITQVSANTHSFTLPYTPATGTQLNVYYSQLFSESYTSDGVRLVYTFDPRDIVPTLTSAVSILLGNSHAVTGSSYASNKKGSNVITLVNVIGISVGDTITISPFVSGTLGLSVKVQQIIGANDVQIDQILYKDIGNGSTITFTRTLSVITTTDPFGKGVITLNTPLIFGTVLTISSYLKPVRIDDPIYGSLQVTNPNAVMQTITADGTTSTFTIPNTFTVGAGDQFIFRQTTSDGSIAPNEADYDTALTGGDLAYSTATGLSADDILVDGDGFVTPSTSPAPEEVVPGQVVDTVAIKIYDKPGSGSANIHVDPYIGDGVTRNYAISQTPNSAGAVIVRNAIGTLSTILTAPDDYIVDYQNQQIIFTYPPARGTYVSITSIGFNGSNILEIDHFTGDGNTLEFITNAKYIASTSQAVYVNGVAQTVTIFETDTTYANPNRIGIRFLTAPAADSLITYIIVAGSSQTFSVAKKERLVGNGTTDYNLQYAIGNGLPVEGSMIVRVDNTILRPPGVVYFTIKSNKYTYTIDSARYAPSTVPVQSVVVIAGNTTLNFNTDWKFVPNGISIVLNSAVAATYSGQQLKVSVASDVGYVYIPGATPKIRFANTYDTGHTIEVISNYNHDILDIESTNRNITPGLTSSYTVDTAEFFAYKSLFSGVITLERPVINSSYVWVEQNGQLLNPDVDYALQSDMQSIKLAIPPNANDVFRILTFSSNILKSGIAYMQFKDMLNRTVFKRLNKLKQTELTAELKPTDLTITVKDASKFDVPNPAGNKPGIIEIKGERIEFFTLNGNVLGQLRRGTLGTGVGKIYRTGTLVQEIGASETIPYQDNFQTYKILSDGTNTVPLTFTPTNSGVTSWLNAAGYTFIGEFNPSYQYTSNNVVTFNNLYYLVSTVYTLTTTQTVYPSPSNTVYWTQQSQIPVGYGQSNDIDVFVGGYVTSDWVTGVNYSVGMIVNYGSYQYKCLTAHTSTTFSADSANWQYFVINIRLKKSPYNVHNINIAPTSPEGDTTFDADFAVDGRTNSLRLTNTLAAGTQVTVIKRSGTDFDGKVTPNLLVDDGPIATFVKAVPGSWYTQISTLPTPAFDNNAFTFDNTGTDLTFDQG
jgi:hypothetical protein